MDGSDGSATDLRMSLPQSTGAFLRMTTKSDGSLLLEGAHENGVRCFRSSEVCLAHGGTLSGHCVGMAGANEEVLKARELSRETIQKIMDAGQGQLHTDFASMHAAIMAKACRGNRCFALFPVLWCIGLL